MVVGLALVVAGLAMAIFPRAFVAVAPFYRLGISADRPTAQTIRAARIGALLLVVAGAVVVAVA